MTFWYQLDLVEQIKQLLFFRTSQGHFSKSASTSSARAFSGQGGWIRRNGWAAIPKNHLSAELSNFSRKCYLNQQYAPWLVLAGSILGKLTSLRKLIRSGGITFATRFLSHRILSPPKIWLFFGNATQSTGYSEPGEWWAGDVTRQTDAESRPVDELAAAVDECTDAAS